MSSHMATNARKMTEGKPLNRSLSAAKASKQDEFYTQYVDIQKEVEAYLEFDPDTFRGKVVYCNCDDPFESNFFKYFAANFNKLGLKKLVTTSYDGSPIAGQGTLFPEYNEGNGKRQKPKALAVTLDHVKDEDGDGAANVTDVELFLKRNKAARIALKADEKYPGGDFRSPECIALLKEADIVVTNPPFSLFREYVAQLVEHGKKFLIIGNVQAITYKEVFPLIKADKLWMGVTIHSGDREFRVPDHYPLNAAGWRVDENGVKYIRVKGVRWYTNLDHGRRHQKLPLMTMEDNLQVQQAQGDQRQGGIQPVRQLRRHRSAFHRRDPRRLRRRHGRPDHLPRQVQPRPVRDSGDSENELSLATRRIRNTSSRESQEESNRDQAQRRRAIKADRPSTDQTYYVVDGEYYVQHTSESSSAPP